MTYTADWIKAGQAAQNRAEAEPCFSCGTTLVVGYSNLGVPVACCPACSPTIAANAGRTIGQAWGLQER